MLKRNFVRLGDSDTVEEVVLNDLLAIPTERTLKDSGALLAPCSIARTGTMKYLAKELGAVAAHLPPNQVVTVNTSAAELFDAETVASLRSSPITIGHPKDDVDIENAKELVKGNLEGMPVPNEAEGTLDSSLVVHDADAIAIINDGAQQLSLGHRAIVVLADEAADYDFEKTHIRCNHVAIVKKGRAGAEAAINDEDTVIFDQDFVDDLNGQLSIETALKDAANEKVTDLETQLADAKALIPDAAAVDKMVSERLVFVQEVTSLCDIDVTGLTELEAKRSVVSKLLDRDMSEKDELYVNTRYEILLEDMDTNQETDLSQELRDAANKATKLKDKAPTISKSEQARQNMINRQSGGTNA